MKRLPYSVDVIKVTQDMCDHNGHMNVKYYYQLFDDAYTKMYIENLGFDEDYLASGFSTFTLEDSIRYLKEFQLNENIYPSFYLYRINKKLLHFVGILLNEQLELSAIFETVLAHVNLNTRKVTEFSEARLTSMLKYKNNNQLTEDLPFDIRLHINDL
jgi:acyl-CoA thioesterase FadM